MALAWKGCYTGGITGLLRETLLTLECIADLFPQSNHYPSPVVRWLCGSIVDAS